MKKQLSEKQLNFSHSRFAFLVLLILCAFVFSSCSKKFVNKKNQALKDFTFQLVLYNQKGQCNIENPEKYYYSKNLNKFFLRHEIDSKGIRFKLEDYYPEVSGLLELSYFYYDYVDSGDWIEALLENIEEEGYDFTINRPFEYSNGENGFDLINSDSVTQRWLSSNKRLNLIKYENEVFVPVKKDNTYILINSSEKETTRAFYDENYLLQKKEFWNVKNAYDSSITKTEEYFYKEDTRLISKKIVTSQDSVNTTFYNEQKLPSRTDVYKVDGDKKYLQTRTLWRYTDDGKINIEESTEFFYTENNYSEYSDKITRRQTYIYKNTEQSENEVEEETVPPDYRYYENGKLKMKTDYQEKGNYTTQIYFDDNYSVQTFYENNIRKKDVYYFDGVVRRVKNYE